METFVQICRLERALLREILADDRTDAWHGHGARSHAEFLAGRYGISQWKARRWIGTAYALEHLPLTAHALESGRLGLDRVVELTRFATPATEKKLISWARHVTPNGIRKRADIEVRLSAARAGEQDRERYLDLAWRMDGSLAIEASCRRPMAPKWPRRSIASPHSFPISRARTLGSPTRLKGCLSAVPTLS